jgi:hypothetical protein
MEDGLNIRHGLRSRHAHDIEEGFKQDDGASSDNDSQDDHALKMSRFGMIVTSCVPSAPLRGRMIRCERRCCESVSINATTQETHRSYVCPGMFDCFYSFCRLRLSRYSIAAALPNNKASLPLRIAESDEFTPDDSFSGSSVLVPDSPKLLDYSKCRAPLPDVSPSPIEIRSSIMDDDDDSSTVDQDLFPSQHYFHDQWIHFYLRVPKSKLQNNPEERAERQTAYALPLKGGSTQPRNIKSRRRSNSPEKTKIKSRRRSNSSDGTDVTPRKPYVAPFPIPMNRENSTEQLNLLVAAEPSTTPNHMPIQKQIIARNNERIVGGGDMVIPINDRTPPAGGESDAALNTHRQPPNSDEEVEQERACRRVRMQRRSSFVAGSKIERFDCNDSNGRTPHRPRNAESYTEWKIDLMVNG